MATTSSGQPILAAVPPPPINLKTPYATILNSKSKEKDTTIYETFDVPIKRPKNINGRHTISWSKKEIQQSILQTNLQYAIMGKFKYGNLDIHELRKVIPSQCGIKGECIIGLLETKVILIRCINREDYINLLSTSGFWLKLKTESVHMRTLKWDIWQDFKKEPPVAMAWISLPNLPPNFFAEDFVKSIAFAVGKPMQVDLATKTNSRPSCARVKVEVDLLGDLPDGVEVGEHDENENIISSKWIKIRYDYLPKYCKTCFLQGHDEADCYSLHPELYPNKNVDDKQKKVAVDNQKNKVHNTHENTIQNTSEPNTIFNNGRLVFNGHPTEEWQQRKKKKKEEEGGSRSYDQSAQVCKTETHKEGQQVIERIGTNVQNHQSDPLALSNDNNFAILKNDDEEQAQEINNEGGEVHLLCASEKLVDDKDETIQPVSLANQGIKSRNEEKGMHMSTMQSTDKANQGIKFQKDVKDGQKVEQNGLESMGDLEVQTHVDKVKNTQHMRAYVEKDGMVDHLNTRNKLNTMETHLGPVLPNNERGPCSPAQNALPEVGPCVKNLARSSSHATPSKADQLGTCAQNIASSNSAQNVKVHEVLHVGHFVHETNSQEMNKATKSTSQNSPAQLTTNAKRDNVVEAVTQLTHVCQENNPAQFPTQDLQVISKFDRLLKLHGTSNINMEIAKKMSNKECQILLKRHEDRTLSPILAYIRKGLIAPPEELAQKKATEPTKPRRVQPTRSSKSNSTRGK